MNTDVHRCPSLWPYFHGKLHIFIESNYWIKIFKAMLVSDVRVALASSVHQADKYSGAIWGELQALNGLNV